MTHLPVERVGVVRQPELPFGNAQAAEIRAVRGQMWLLDLVLATLWRPAGDGLLASSKWCELASSKPVTRGGSTWLRELLFMPPVSTRGALHTRRGLYAA
jgi:hypothetical protein